MNLHVNYGFEVTLYVVAVVLLALPSTGDAIVGDTIHVKHGHKADLLAFHAVLL